jgi:hypothetical protein
MTTAIFALLILLQIKHWYIDFVNQTMDEVHSKAIYGDLRGIGHSAKQGIGTLVCMLIVAGYAYIVYAIILALFDAVIHYHTDWAKMNYGNRDIQTPQFWNHLGLDQMVHQVTYILIAFMMA